MFFIISSIDKYKNNRKYFCLTKKKKKTPYDLELKLERNFIYSKKNKGKGRINITFFVKRKQIFDVNETRALLNIE